MKLSKLVLIVILLAGCFLTVCSKKDDNNNNNGNSPTGPTGQNGSFTAVISGAHNFNFNAISALADKSEIDEFMDISATFIQDGLTYNITASMDGNTPGTYPLTNSISVEKGQGFAFFFVNQNNVPTDSYESMDGAVTITSVNPNIKGTIQFNAKHIVNNSTVTISNGSFNIPCVDADS